MNGWITTDFYDNKLKEYKQRQEEINMELADHTKADKSFYITASLVLELAQRAYKLFMSSKLARRRQLLGILLSNSTLNGKDLKIHLKTPFNSILAYQESPDLCPLLDAFRKMNWHKVFKIPEVIIPQMQELLVSV